MAPRLNRWLNCLGDLALTVMPLIMTQQWCQSSKARRSGSLLDLFLPLRLGTVLGQVRVRDKVVLGLKLWPLHIVAEVCVILFFITAV